MQYHFIYLDFENFPICSLREITTKGNLVPFSFKKKGYLPKGSCFFGNLIPLSLGEYGWAYHFVFFSPWKILFFLTNLT
jgi:hypothetical protein